jgi:glutathione S-transferase
MNFRLRYSRLSPFVRKVLVFAHELGIHDRIELVATDVWDPNSDISVDNPLGKVPALVTDKGVFAGSYLCCEFLQTLVPGLPLIPQPRQDRWPVLQTYTIADGALEAAVAHVVERFRRPKELIYEGNLERQLAKVEGALRYLESTATGFENRIDISTITIGCALEYLDFRLEHFDWRGNAPRLAAWQAVLSERPSFKTTRPRL